MRETGDTVSFLSEEILVFLCPVLSVADGGQAELLIGSAPCQVDVGERLHQVTAKPRVVTFVSQHCKIFTNGFSQKQILHIITILNEVMN